MHTVRGITVLIFGLLLGACASNYQGGVGPLSNPKAAQIVDLVDEMFTRARRINPATTSEEADCLGDTAMGHGDRTLEMVGGIGDDVRRIESRLWKSSAIPSSATRETRCLNRAHAALEKALESRAVQAATERNSLQDRLIAASDQSCGLFKKYLNANQSSTNFLLGSSALVLAAAATNVASPIAAKNYSTGALIASGMSAEFNADMFNSQVTYAISKSIDMSRQKALERLQSLRMNRSYPEYGLSAAIADALRYHELCSLMSGLSSMDNSVTVMSDPGLKHLASWFPSGELSIKDGVINAARVKAGDSAMRSTTLDMHSTALPPLADLLYADSQTRMQQKVDGIKNELTTVSATTGADRRKGIEAAINTLTPPKDPAKDCAWKSDVQRPVFLNEGNERKALCPAKTYLEQLCNISSPDACGTKRGLPLATELTQRLINTHHEWTLATKNPDAPDADVHSKAAAYEIARTAHEMYVKHWLEPAVSAYLDELSRHLKSLD
jgi:hypothetical protein